MINTTNSPIHFTSNHAMAVDPKTVPTVPKLLPPLPRISPLKKNIDQICLQWDKTESGKSVPAMVCLASHNADSTERKNPFSGYYINYLYGQDKINKYKQHTENGKVFNFDSEDGNCTQIDIGSNVELGKTHINKVCEPTINIASQYLDSWKDGSQTKFVRNFTNAAIEGDGVKLAYNSMDKLIKLFFSKE